MRAFQFLILGALLGAILTMARADVPKLCWGNNPGCVTKTCIGSYNGYSCAQFKNIAYNTCEPDIGKCPEIQVDCADITYFAGSNICINGKCEIQYQVGTDKAKATGCEFLW
jgi:hypothetical protein